MSIFLEQMLKESLADGEIFPRNSFIGNRWAYISLLTCINETLPKKNGDGFPGLDLNSGWNWTPT